jgi:hypothetical protein
MVFTKMREVVVQNCLLCDLKNIFQESLLRYELPYLKLYWINDLVHFMFSSHFIASPKVGASKAFLFQIGGLN